MKRCDAHNIQEPCILCAKHAWPVRDIWAVADFAGNPLNGWPDGIPPEVETIRFSEVIRIIGRKMREVELIRLSVLDPFYAARKSLRIEAREVKAIDAGKLEQAAILLAAGKPPPEDDLIALYMQTIQEDQSSW